MQHHLQVWQFGTKAKGCPVTFFCDPLHFLGKLHIVFLRCSQALVSSFPHAK
jgi:hypothetical protein